MKPMTPGGPLGNAMVQVLDANTGRELIAISSKDVSYGIVALNPNSQFLVSFESRHDSTPPRIVKVWEMPSGPLKSVLKLPPGDVTSMAVIPDGQRIISAHNDGTVRLWDPATGQEMLVLKHKGYTSGTDSMRLSVSGDGRHIVARGSDGNDTVGTVTVWEAP